MLVKENKEKKMVKEIIVEINGVKKAMSLNDYYQMYLNGNPKHLVDSCGMDKLVSSLHKKEK